MSQPTARRPRPSRSLVAAAREGQPDAVRELLDQCRPIASRLARRFSRTAEDAADLTQEILFRLFEQLHTFRQESSFHTWLYRLAVNVCLNAQRQAARHAAEVLNEQIPDRSVLPDRRCVRRELAQQIADAVERLPEGLRTVFVLVQMEGLPYSRVAEILDLSVEAVRMRMSRARGELRKMLEPYLNDGG